MITIKNKIFDIKTHSTSYIFYVNDSGYLCHLYYGARLDNYSLESLIEPAEFGIGNGIVDRTMPNLSMENTCFEISTIGKGDVREHFIEIIAHDTSYINSFVYDSHEVLFDYAHPDLAYAKKNSSNTEILKITLVEKRLDITLELYYQIFDDSDVLVKWSRVICNGNPFTLQRLMSSQLDLDTYDYTLHSLHGKWINEANLSSQKVENKIIIDSKCGTSSSRHNPFFFLQNEHEVYGFNLIYSGNHQNIIEKNSFDKTRVLQGIHDFHFQYDLKEGESFTSAQAVLTFSNSGVCGMQKNMHSFVLDHIIPQKFAYKERPILINSWEANYFDFNEARLVKLAKKAKEVGIELFVLDDGWFSNRNDDKSSLGDWYVNTKKLPNGLDGLAKKINALGLDFGLWIEPEMISVDSELYRAHPEYAVTIDENYQLGRNQLILDLTNLDVIKYLKETFYTVLRSANISYIKWDMNRIFSDMYGSTLSHQGMFFHEYQKGLVEFYTYLTESFPDILFENCASGGNRFDLGMLCFSPQIWASDNTDAYERLKIQSNLLLGYPQSTMGSHVSAKINHQTLRHTPLSSRFNIAAFGALGYELNLVECSKDDLDEIASQVAFYKEHRMLFQYGTIEVKTFGNYYQFNIVDRENKKGALMIMNGLTKPHNPSVKVRYPFLLDSEKVTVQVRRQQIKVKEFGDLVNTITPIHVKQESLFHNMIDTFYKMESEQHEFTTSPEQLTTAGFYLPTGFCAIGYNEKTRLFKDFDSRMYIIAKV